MIVMQMLVMSAAHTECVHGAGTTCLEGGQRDAAVTPVC